MTRIRLPLLLYSYVTAELLAPFFASFAILYGVFFLVRLIPLLDVVLSLGIGMADFIRLFAYIFPHMLLYVIPMACMTGVIIAFTRLTNDREILAFKACGISLRQIALPVVLVSAAIALLTGFFSIHLIPAGEVSMRHLMFQLAKEKIDRGIKERQFTEALGDLVVYVDTIDDEEKWHGVYVSDMRNRKQPIITVAKQGGMQADINRMRVTIVLEQGTLHNMDGPDNEVIHFQRYQLQIPIKPPTRVGGDDVTRLDKGSMSQQALLAAGADPKLSPKQRIAYLVEYHHRLVLPVGCFILGLLGMPLGLQAGPGRRAAGIPLGLAFFVLYYLSFTLSRVMVEEMIWPLVLGMWMPNIVFLVLTLVVFHRVEQEKPLIPQALVDRLAPLWRLATVPVKKGVRALARTAGRLLPGRRRKTTPPAEPEGLLVHANALSLVFHLPGCEYYDCENCTIKFKDVEVAQKAGFKPCRFCRNLIETVEPGADSRPDSRGDNG